MATITESLIRRARPRARAYELSCSTVRGFILRVLPSGEKVFYARSREGGRDSRRRVGRASELTLEDARRRALELLGRLPGGDASSPAPRRRAAARAAPAPTLRRFAPRFLAEHVTVYLKPGTQRRYRDHLARHLLPALGDRRLDAITAADVTRLHGSMRETPAQANNALSVLSTLFSCAARWGALPADHAAPTQYVRKYKLRARARFLTPEERARLERALAEGERVASGRAGALRWSTVGAIRLLALTGMRRGEVLGLRWSMVDRRRRCLRLPDSKTGQKVVPISGHALALLDELARRRAPGCDYVLYSSQRRPLHTSTLEDSWRIVRARAGLEGVRLHDLRHSAASDAINAGVSLEVIREILGHADIRTTQRYAHLTRGVIAEGVERMGASIVAASGEGDSPA